MATIKKQLLGMSNSTAFFVPVWKTPEYLRLIIALSGKNKPTICFIGAARGENCPRVAEFYELSKREPFAPKILDLFNMQTDEESEYFADTDIVYIDGGSTRNLLALMREWKLGKALRNAYNSGVLIVGASAGINIFYEWSMTDSVKTVIRPVAGFGLLKGSVCPHYDSREDRQIAFADYLKSSDAKYPAYAIEDDVAMHIVNDQLHQVYTISPESSLIEFNKEEGSFDLVHHTALFLGSCAQADCKK